MKLTLKKKQRIRTKLTKKGKELDNIFNNFMEEKYPIAYKLNKLNYQINKEN